MYATPLKTSGAIQNAVPHAVIGPASACRLTTRDSDLRSAEEEVNTAEEEVNPQLQRRRSYTRSLKVSLLQARGAAIAAGTGSEGVSAGTAVARAGSGLVHLVEALAERDVVSAVEVRPVWVHIEHPRLPRSRLLVFLVCFATHKG